MHSQRLNQEVMISILPLNRETERLESPSALLASLYSAMLREPKDYILIWATQLPWRAVVIVSVGHDPAMNLPDEFASNWLIRRQT